MLKRGLLNTSPYAFNRQYFLVNDHNDVRVLKWFLGVPNLRRSTPFYIFMHFLPGISLLTLWRFVTVVVTSELPKKERIRKTAKY